MRPVSVLIVIALLLSVVPAAYADGPVDKLGRGLVNILFSPVELFNPSPELKKENDNIGSRFGNFLYRAGVGVVEVATFPIPVPEDYGPIIGREGYVMTEHYAEQSESAVEQQKKQLRASELEQTAIYGD